MMLHQMNKLKNKKDQFLTDLFYLKLFILYAIELFL